MHRLTIIYLLIAITFFSQFASSVNRDLSREESGFVFEPYIGYERGYLTQVGIPEVTTMGANYGARVGVRQWGVGFGIDYLMSAQSAEQSGQNGDFKLTEIGIFLNYKVLSDWRIYATYLYSAKAKIQTDANPLDFTGSGYKLGLGWNLFKYFDINLELYSRSYEKYDGSTLANSLLSSPVGFSLSFPIL